MERASRMDRFVDELYRMARAKPGDVLRPTEILRRILGPENVVLVPGLLSLARLVDRKRVEIRAGLLPAITQWAAGHEGGHLVRGTEHSGELVEELICDRIGAAIQMPRRAFMKRAKQVKGDVRQLAIDFGVTETSVALRLGETDGRAIAVVAPHRVYARGALEKARHELLRQWANEGHPTIVRAMLSDAPGRTMLERLA